MKPQLVNSPLYTSSFRPKRSIAVRRKDSVLNHSGISAGGFLVYPIHGGQQIKIMMRMLCRAGVLLMLSRSIGHPGAMA